MWYDTNRDTEINSTYVYIGGLLRSVRAQIYKPQAVYAKSFENVVILNYVWNLDEIKPRISEYGGDLLLIWKWK